MKRFLLLTYLCLFFSIQVIAQEKTVTVKDAQAFLDAIAPNTTIIVDIQGSNNYGEENWMDLMLTDSTKKSDYYRFEYLFEQQREIIIHHVRNLKIVGKGKNKTHVVNQNAYADILTFESCENITIQDIKLGHGYSVGTCVGGVVNFINTKTVDINRAVLYGSGIYGIISDNLTQLTCSNTSIEGCSYGILDLKNSSDLQFNICRFSDNAQMDMVLAENCKNVVMTQCYFKNNYVYEIDYEYYLFNLKNTVVILKDCTFLNNHFPFFCNDKEAVQFIATKPAFEEFYKSKTLGSNNFAQGLFKK